MELVTDAFEDLSHALRVLLEADLRANRYGLLNTDRAEAVGNIEMGLAAVFNAFHSLYDALDKTKSKSMLNWYECPELATILILRNARHHNQAKKVRTMYSFYAQEAKKLGSMEMYILVDFPPSEDGGDTFNVYLSWADFQELISLPKKQTRLREATVDSVRSYITGGKFSDYAAYFELDEERLFFNVVPLIVNAAIKLIPLIELMVNPRSVESETYLSLFKDMCLIDTREHEVNCGPIAFMP